MWVNSGKREGVKPETSMHAQGLAIDLVICGMNSMQTAKKLREAGFTCIIEYYDHKRKPCNMAHADMRNTSLAIGDYAPDGRKAKTCPLRSVSRNAGCNNTKKNQWRYEFK